MSSLNINSCCANCALLHWMKHLFPLCCLISLKVESTLRTPTAQNQENGVLQQQWLATTCFWAEVLGCEVVVGALEKRLSHFARPSTYHGPIGSCPKTAKNDQNPKWHTEMPKWGPKSANTPKQPGSVQPSAWHSAHTCWQQPQACVCQLRPLGANTKGQTCPNLKPMGPRVAG